jgi:hypothetical protein
MSGIPYMPIIFSKGQQNCIKDMWCQRHMVAYEPKQ